MGRVLRGSGKGEEKAGNFVPTGSLCLGQGAHAVRILHYIESLLPMRGGPVRAVSDLCNALAARGHQVTLWTGELPESGAPRAKPGTPTIQKIDVRMDRLPRLGRAERDRVRSLVGGYDVVHLHGLWTLANIQIANDAKKLGVPYLVTIRGMLDDWCMEQGRMRKRLFLKLCGTEHLENAAVVHLTAKAEETQARKWFPKGTSTVLPNFLDLTPFRNAPGPELARKRFPRLAEVNGSGASEPMVLFLSRIHRKKGIETLLKAIANVKARGVDCVVAIAGSGDEAYLAAMKKLADELAIGDRTIWTGHVGGELKVSLYEAADIFALPTHSENFGFVFPEAMASGTPVLTTRGVDIWPELEASGAATILDTSVEAFENEILRLLSHRESLDAMRAKAKPWVFDAFDEQKLLDKYEAMYASCLKKK